MALTDTPVPVLTAEEADAPRAAAPKLRRMSFGLLLVYVAILAVNSGGNGILLPNIVAGLDEAGKIGNLAIVTTVAFIAHLAVSSSHDLGPHGARELIAGAALRSARWRHRSRPTTWSSARA